MKKSLLILIILGASNFIAQAQQDSVIDNKIKKLEAQVNKQEQEINQISLELDKDYWTYRGVKKETQEKITQQKNTIDSLNQLINSSNQRLVDVNDNLNSKIKHTEKTVISSNSKISELDNSLDKNRRYWIIASLVTLLLGGLIYWLLGKRIATSKTDLEGQIEKTKTELERKSKELDNKLVEVYDKQLKILDEIVSGLNFGGNDNVDHSLALKVADEIVRMQKNISKMDEGTKGLKPLTKGIERIQNNFAANGYEMINLLNTEYDERNNIDVINFITDENLAENKRIISAVIKPQVNYNGVLIQRAQVDVSQN